MPTDNVHLLRAERPVNESAVERLELALEDARKGNITAVAIASVGFDGSARTAFSKAENAITLLGAIQYLSARMANELLKD